MKSVLLDTSFIFKCAEWAIDPFEAIDRACYFPYQLFYIDKTLLELEQVASRSGKHKHWAKLARLFLSKAKVIKTTENELVDELLMNHAATHPGCVMATHDKELKQRAIQKGIPVLFIRQKKYVELSGSPY
jgi:uncharacterized protein